jgi:hypothetical protein
MYYYFSIEFNDEEYYIGFNAFEAADHNSDFYYDGDFLPSVYERIVSFGETSERYSYFNGNTSKPSTVTGNPKIHMKSVDWTL